MSEAVTLSPGDTFPPAPESGGDDPDLLRRRFLTTATVGLGVVGAAATSVPFIESWLPSERARALGAPVEIDISKLRPGTLLTAQWRQRPVLVLRRLPQQVAVLPTLNDRLKDPLSHEAQQVPDLPNWNPIQRSVNPEYLLVVGICTHLGCIPKYHPDVGEAALGANWPGGFFCPCHGSRYDLAGRVMDGSPAPLNLPVPPHYYKSPTVIVTGDLAAGGEGDWAPDKW